MPERKKKVSTMLGKKPKSTPVPQRKMELIRPTGGIQCVYVNNYSIGQTLFDLRFVFGEITDVTNERIEVTQRVQVTMSWLEAKSFSEHLARFVKTFEDKNGLIKTKFAKPENPPPPNIPETVDQ
jgi:hypothetical protein